jgi:hypothetical protein
MRILFGVVTAFLLVLVARQALACSCAEPPPPKESLAKATVVFSGKVVKIEQDVPGDPNAPRDIMPKRVTLEVKETWKGTRKRRVVITTAGDTAQCGYPFQDGKIYLVYCFGKKEKLNTNLCTRTTLLESAAADLKDLGPGRRGD